MNIMVVGLGSFFAVLSSAIIAHISMATPLGPWIAPTIVIISGVLLKIFRRSMVLTTRSHQELALIQTVGSVGGIVAMGVGFTLPMLHFLEPELFAQWLAQPDYFCRVVAAACISAGGVGICLARMFANNLIIKENLSFPVSGLIYKTITAQAETSQAKRFFSGFSLSLIFTTLRDGLGSIPAYLPGSYYFLPRYFGKDIALSIQPMLWSMGFIAGMGIIYPLFIGMISKYLVLYPLNNHAAYLPVAWFEPMRASKFAMAFCAGLVLVGISFTALKLPLAIYRALEKVSLKHVLQRLRQQVGQLTALGSARSSLSAATTLEVCAVIAVSYLFLQAFNFSLLAQVFMIGLTAIFAYQISYFSGKVGLVPFGRFATFVMVPTMILFKLNALQITMLCVFANICYGLATDLLFDYKVGQKCGLDFATIHRHQWLGLLVTSLGLGFVLWLLMTNFELGSAELFALRARNRALLIQSLSFDWQPVVLGFLFGWVLKRCRINPMMVFGGILMPGYMTFSLMIGALFSYLDKNAEQREPLWSGLFAGEPMMVLTTLATRLL